MKDNSQPMDDAAALQLCLERDRLLSDAKFSRAPSMCTLLRFLVDYKLSGNKTPLKSYTIATDALGRDPSFDTQTDSYPRVQMGRLRRMLDNFYLQNGGENRLSIAAGKYEIILEPNIAPPENQENLIGQRTVPSGQDEQVSMPPESDAEQLPAMHTASQRLSRRRLGNILGVCILSALIIILAYFLWPGQELDEIDYPRVALDLPDAGAGANTNDLAETIENHLIRRLNGFDGLRVFGPDPDQAANSGYVIRLRLLDAAVDQMELRLLDAKSGEILWSKEIGTANEADLKLELDRAIVALVGHHGEIARTDMSNLANDYSAGYPCLLQFNQYIRYREKEKLEPVSKCLRKSVRRFPNDAYLLSVVAFAQNMAQRSDSKSKAKGVGMDFARQAEELDQNSAAASFAISQSAFSEGDCATGVAWGKKAVELNPLNSRISGYLGLYMIGCQNPEGERYAVRALELDPNADLTIAAAVAFQMLKRGDAKASRELSSVYMASSPRNEPGLELTYILSSAMLNDRKEARRVWKILAARYGLSEKSPPREVLSRWIVSPLLISEIMKMIDRTRLFDK